MINPLKLSELRYLASKLSKERSQIIKGERTGNFNQLSDKLNESYVSVNSVKKDIMNIELALSKNDPVQAQKLTYKLIIDLGGYND